LDVTKGAAYRTMAVTIADVGGGFGTWTVELAPQTATAGAQLDLSPSLTIAPGGYDVLTAVARADAAATPGDDYGFIVLRRGTDVRRIPYEFTVEKPGLASVTPVALKLDQVGDTRTGESKASAYRWPTAPFGPPASYTGPPMDETGAEHPYVTPLDQPTFNAGVAVIAQSPGSLIDPFFLGSPDENDVMGYTGTPANVNGYLDTYKVDVQAVGIQYPVEGQYYIA